MSCIHVQNSEEKKEREDFQLFFPHYHWEVEKEKIKFWDKIAEENLMTNGQPSFPVRDDWNLSSFPLKWFLFQG